MFRKPREMQPLSGTVSRHVLHLPLHSTATKYGHGRTLWRVRQSHVQASSLLNQGLKFQSVDNISDVLFVVDLNILA
jgi:hypothetical protein